MMIRGTSPALVTAGPAVTVTMTVSIHCRGRRVTRYGPVNRATTTDNAEAKYY